METEKFTDLINEAINYAQKTNYRQWQDTADLCLYVSHAGNLCAFGMGKFFEDAYPYVSDAYHFTYLVDNASSKWGTKKYGLTCKSPSELCNIHDVTIVIGMIGDDKGVAEQCSKLGLEYHHLNELIRNMYTKRHDSLWFLRIKNQVYDAFNLLEDDLSKRIFTKAIIDRIAPHLMAEPFFELQTSDEYFHLPFWSITKNETFLDIGAYTGDTIQLFRSVTENEYHAIIGYEMDNNTFCELHQYISKLKDDRISIFNQAISDATSEADHMISIDNIKTDLPITLIKMDIEGFEKKAIMGACRVIREDKPKLAICVYHLLEDLWEIPLKIHQLNPDYRLYLRHHSPTVWDTVLYAAPRKE